MAAENKRRRKEALHILRRLKTAIETKDIDNGKAGVEAGDVANEPAQGVG